MNFEKEEKDGKSRWKWVEVEERKENKRYLLAIKESKKYMNKVLKNVNLV